MQFVCDCVLNKMCCEACNKNVLCSSGVDTVSPNAAAFYVCFCFLGPVWYELLWWLLLVTVDCNTTVCIFPCIMISTYVCVDLHWFWLCQSSFALVWGLRSCMYFCERWQTVLYIYTQYCSTCQLLYNRTESVHLTAVLRSMQLNL